MRHVARRKHHFPQSTNVRSCSPFCGIRRGPLALEFHKRPGGQAQFSTVLAMQVADDRFGALREGINAHLGDDLSLSVPADQAGMSGRRFSRHYAEATGQTPVRATERLRVETAWRLLSESRTPVKHIAERCGFGSEETTRRSFRRHAPRLPVSIHAATFACFRLDTVATSRAGLQSARRVRHRRICASAAPTVFFAPGWSPRGRGRFRESTDRY